MTIEELFEQQHGGKDAKTSTDHEETFTTLYVIDFAKKCVGIKWNEACEAQRKICAENAVTTEKYPSNLRITIVNKQSILNAPKPEYKP